jgi:hypothetical protein
MLAAKFFDDQYFNNAYYAKVGGVPPGEMNSLEIEFLFMLNFNLFGATETFQQYFIELCKHTLNSPCDCHTGMHYYSKIPDNTTIFSFIAASLPPPFLIIPFPCKSGPPLYILKHNGLVLEYDIERRISHSTLMMTPSPTPSTDMDKGDAYMEDAGMAPAASAAGPFTSLS